MSTAFESTTAEVIDSFAGTPDARLRELVQELARHLHAFVAETRPTVAEWSAAIEYVTQLGRWSTDVRQEVVLFSDVLGVSSAIETLNGAETGTESTVLGPFHMTESPVRALGDSIDLVGTQPPCVVTGQVCDTGGVPVPGATVDVWQCDERGFYDVQEPDRQPAGNGRGLFTVDDQGRFWFRTVLPSHYPIPMDGPVGRLLTATGRHPYRPAHIHLLVRAPGFTELTTHMFVAGSPYLDSDAVFAVKPSLVVPFTRTEDAGLAARFGVSVPFTHADFAVTLERATDA